ncbi:MAG: carbamoyltransferase HypF [Terriglobia bacterium]
MRAISIHVRGIVQGVGFRPFVYRLARSHQLSGWVRNGECGVEIHLEGPETAFGGFIQDLKTQPPRAARISAVDTRPAEFAGYREFTICESGSRTRPTVRISPDLPICDACLDELADPTNSRYGYPYINCTDCGPRYTVIEALPYDRLRTTMKRWPLDDYCAGEYHDPANRRFHAQPVACPECGPHYHFLAGGERVSGDDHSIRRAVELLRSGAIVAIKGIGGYHLACDAMKAEAVRALRERKYRKEKPFALMARDVDAARRLGCLTDESEALLTSDARPIVLVPAKAEMPDVAPDNDELGVILPYAPLHHLIFAAGAPEALVMTSANRSSEPIAYEDQEALERLAGIADGFLVGERPIARRVDDSVVRAGVCGPAILRRSRGYAPGAAATLPAERPLLAVGADLKNTITLVVDGQAFVSQHIGDLDQYECLRAFQETVEDLISMYEVRWDDVLVAHDLHPQYISTARALELPASGTCAVQHHRAHLASVLAERGEWEKHVLGISFDGTGYGDDGTIWGGEIFAGSVSTGFERLAHLRTADLAGGDAAAKHPVQAAAGFLGQVDEEYGMPDLAAAPFAFPPLYRQSLELLRRGVRVFRTTSAGRLFDAAAALLGFTRSVTFEGQAAVWLEHLARRAPSNQAYPFPLVDGELDFRPLLLAMVNDRLRGRDRREIARAFHRGIAEGLYHAVESLGRTRRLDTVVLSGGVFQNELLLQELKSLFDRGSFEMWTNHVVPPNDGGISLGQAALAALDPSTANRIEEARAATITSARSLSARSA